MTVGAKNVAFLYFSQQFCLRHLRVLANIKQFFAAHMVKVKRRRVRIIPANATAFRRFNTIYQRTPRNLKSASSS
jgi:adenylosuccinate synthase